MTWTRGRGAQGVGPLVVVLLAQWVLGGCAQSETLRTVKSPVSERRTQVVASEPLLRSEWQVEGGRIQGHVVWGSCVREQSWSVEEQRIQHLRPLPAAGLITLGAGLAAVIAGIATRDTQSRTVVCTGALGNECDAQVPDNTGSNVATIMGSLTMGVGTGLLLIKPSDTITVLKHEPHAEKSVSPCIVPEDLSTLVLLLKLGPNRFVHVTVDAQGEASADLPASARLPKGADLEILVYRAPAVFANKLPRWTAIGHVHVPD